MTANPAPLVTRDALQAFTQCLVKHFAPEQVILFGSQARGEARWDSDADILVVMPFEGQPQDTVKGMRNTCEPAFPLDLHLRRPEEIAPRYRWADPFIREALNHGVMLHGEGRPDAVCPGDGGPMTNAKATPGARVHTPTRNPVVNEWIARAERHWRMAEQMADLTVSYQSGLFLAQLCLETYLRAALIAQGVDSRKCPEPTHDGAWAIAHAGPLRACLRGWFDSLEELN